MSPRPPFGPFGPDLLAAGSGFALLFFAVTTVTFFANRRFVEAGADQPVAFDHRLHVEEEGLDCADCHGSYEERASFRLPARTSCALCHLEPQGESAEEQKLVEILREDAPLEWVSLFRQPPHVFFPHRQHVVVAELECEICHGGIASSTRPPRERQPLTMDTCIECHEREGGSVACTSCHR